MSATVLAFRSRFPEYSNKDEYPDPRIQVFLDDAVLCYLGSDENRWCGKYDIAQCYLAAHLLTLANATEAGSVASAVGPVSSKSADGVSVTRAVAVTDRSDGDAFFLSTAYGQRFLVIRGMCFVGIAVANCL